MSIAPTPKKLMPKDILDEVEGILRRAVMGYDRRPAWLTAYQIFHRLPTAMQRRIEQERGPMGVGGGSHYASGNVVVTACRSLHRIGKVDIGYLDARGIRIDDGAGSIVPSFDYCGIYRINV